MNKKLIFLFSSAILLAGCHTIDDIKHYYDTHIVFEERLRRNNAPVEFPYLLGSIMCEVPYMDTFAVSWLAEHDKEHRIFVLGHTHNPLMMAERFDDRSQGYIYVNTGAWVDDKVSNYFTRSFVNLYFGEDGFIQVCTRQICKDGSIKNLYTPLWLKK